MTEQPFALRELARTRVNYEHGRFLMDAVLRLSGDERDRIVAWAIETSQPGIFDPQTTEQFICRLARAESARSRERGTQ